MRLSRSASFMAAALLLAAGTSLPAQGVTPAPLRRAQITFGMKATKVSDFVGRVDSVQASFAGRTLATVTGVVEFRVRDMHTGIGLRDTHMRNAMRADSFPTIRFVLTGVDVHESRGDSVAVVFRGTLTIHGVTRPQVLPGTVIVPPGGGTTVQLSFPLNMRNYGIEPPTRFFGAVRVDPVVAVGVTLDF